MPRDKRKVTKANMRKAISIYERALQLQRDMYDFVDILNDMGMEHLAQQLSDGAFEMDLTWNNAEKVAKELIAMYKTSINPSLYRE